ncbi:3-deoxy-7-phosphoheptulonate synthase [Actinophytocola sp.]|uniref:3-deoxy-7-phosphoheptulonate synthase n=1 Tax=Actinophytocola sp. TaxID=1872138 RepID=UPI003D6BFED2
MRTVAIGDVEFGAGGFPVIAGPCSVESDYLAHARAAASSGADVLRGSVFKPRSGPDRFQGIGPEGIPLLARARDATGLPVIAEPLDAEDVQLLEPHVDGFLVGARSMHNSRLLQSVGATGRPVVLKRAFAATYDEWLGAADYVRSTGNDEVILCERGIRTFVTETRNTLDISAVPVLRTRTDLPVIVDPSHASGRREWVLPLAMAAAGVLADGLIVECHTRPHESWTDSDQAIEPPELKHLIDATRQLSAVSRALTLRSD